MRITNRTDLLHGFTVTSREPPTPELVLVVRGTFGFDAAGKIVPLEGILALVQGSLSADAYADDDPDRTGELVRAGDFAAFKPSGEVLVHGSCHLNKAVRQCRVELMVGDWTKTVVVSGDRHWSENGEASKPDLFDVMPLGFSHAFGGAEYVANPVGRGFQSAALPNVELERDLVIDRESRPRPGCLGPINPSWFARSQKRGQKYGSDYARSRAPYYPEDFDWTYFMAGPPDQWLSGYLTGGERLTATNLLASHPQLDTKLPGKRVRAFVLDVKGLFREVVMRLDTVAIDADEERISLSWRGLDVVEERDLADVAFVLVVEEKLADAPLPLAHYRREMAEIEADPIGFEKAKAEALGEQELLADVDPFTQRALDRGITLPVEMQRDNKQIWQSIESTEQVDEKKLLADIDAAHADPPDDPPPAVPAFPGGSARLFLRPQWEQVQQQVAHTRAQLRPGEVPPARLVAAEEQLQDPRILKLDPTIRPATTAAVGPGADLSGQDLSGRDLRGADLRGAKLDGCVCIGTDFDSADLTGASLQGAMLFRANFSRANLAGADLALCNGARAIFRRADLSSARLEEGYFDHADFSAATLERAYGALVVFTEANLQGLQARGLQLTRSSFESAQLEGASFAAAQMSECRFHNSSGARCCFDGATIEAAVFSESKLAELSCVGATLERSVWLDCDMTGADLSGMIAPDAHFTGATLNDARLVGADLRNSRFYRASLARADFSRSNLFGADLSHAKLDHTLFVRANLYDAKLLEAAGPGCDFSRANLKRAIYEVQT